MSNILNLKFQTKQLSEKIKKIENTSLNQVKINQNDIKDLKANGAGGGTGSITGIIYSAANDELQVSKKIQSSQSIFSPNITHNTNMVNSNNLAISNNTTNLHNFTVSTVNSLQTNSNNITNNTNNIATNETGIQANATNLHNFTVSTVNSLQTNQTNIQNNTTAISNLQSASNRPIIRLKWLQTQ